MHVAPAVALQIAKAKVVGVDEHDVGCLWQGGRKRKRQQHIGTKNFSKRFHFGSWASWFIPKTFRFVTVLINGVETNSNLIFTTANFWKSSLCQHLCCRTFEGK